MEINREQEQKRGLLAKLRENFFSLMTTGNVSEDADRQTPKNRAKMCFDSLQLGELVFVNSSDEIRKIKTHIPVNPKEDVKWQELKLFNFSYSDDTRLNKVSKAINHALYLISQAVEYDRYLLKQKGDMPIRDAILGHFKPGREIQNWDIQEDSTVLVTFDRNKKSIQLSSQVFEDYFLLVRSLLMAGTMIENDCDNSSGTVQVARGISTAQILVAERLEMVKRYVEKLENEEQEAKLLWGAALNFHISQCRFDSITHQIGALLVEISEAAGDAYFYTLEFAQNNKLNSELEDQFQNFFKDITSFTYSMKFEFPICIHRFRTDENGCVRFLLGDKRTIKIDDNQIYHTDIDEYEDIVKRENSLSIYDHQSREKLIKYICENQKLWYTSTWTPDRLSEKLRSLFRELVPAFEVYLEQRKNYSNFFDLS